VSGYRLVGGVGPGLAKPMARFFSRAKKCIFCQARVANGLGVAFEGADAPFAWEAFGRPDQRLATTNPRMLGTGVGLRRIHSGAVPRDHSRPRKPRSSVLGDFPQHEIVPAASPGSRPRALPAALFLAGKGASAPRCWFRGHNNVPKNPSYGGLRPRLNLGPRRSAVRTAVGRRCPLGPKTIERLRSLPSLSIRPTHPGRPGAGGGPFDRFRRRLWEAPAPLWPRNEPPTGCAPRPTTKPAAIATAPRQSAARGKVLAILNSLFDASPQIAPQERYLKMR